MIFQALAPSTEVFAQELDAVMEASVSAARAAGNTARSVQDAVASALQDADQATSDDTATTPGADAGAADGGDGSTNAGESQDSTTGGTASGDASTEGDASQDDAAADDGAADEEQADDADTDAAAQASTDPAIKTAGELKAALVDGKVTVNDAGEVTAITFGSNADLIAISNTNPAIYQNASISKTGLSGIDFDVCSAQAVGDLGSLAFQGFGSDDHPFKGTLDLGGRSLTANKTLFNNIELNGNNGTVKLIWKGTDAQPIVAAKVAGGGKTLSATITVDKPNETSVVKLTSPLVGEVTGVLALDATYATSTNIPLAIDMQSSAGNLGLLANTLVEGASLTLAGLTLPDKLNGTPTINATDSGANAGGLIGEARAGATVALPTGVDISALNVAGKNAAGGIIGKATNLTLTVGTDNSGKDDSGKSITVKPAGAVGSSSAGTYAGGLIGDASFAGEFTINSGIFDFGKGVDLSVSNTSAPPSAGGLFGVLDISSGDVTVNGGSYTSTLQNGKDNSNNNGVRGNYGGLVGKLWGQKYGNDALYAFTVQNGAVVSFGVGSNGKLTYAGGLVGYLGQGSGSPNVSAVVINDATVTCATSGYASNNGKYGGAVGVVDTNNVLEVRGLKVETAGNATIGGSNGGFAGVVGSSWLGIVKFSGITDLSGAAFAENDHTAQLVYENFNSLIFAAGSGSDTGATKGDTTKWQYKRPATQVKIDDIYSYGQVIRLGSRVSDNLITISDTHQWSFSSKLVKTGDAFALASVDDFAKLVITWQTSGYFSAVEGVTNSKFASQVPSTNITLSADINLSGTGLTGLTKDRVPRIIDGIDENSHSFTGMLNGNGHTISLTVGEPYGMRGNSKIGADDTSAGNGKIYRHGRLGLFAAVNGAAASNVTIAGSMKFDNQSNVDAGALAGVKVGGDTSLTAVTFSTGIEYESINRDNYVHAGGVFGSISGAGSLRIGNRESPSAINSSIVSKAQERGATCVGGAVGYISGDSVPSDTGKTVEVDGLTISGSIAVNNGSVKTYAGGLIGQIKQGGFDGNSGAKQVAITKLDFANFSLATAGVNAGNSAGLLGYSWGGTEVTLGDASVNKDDSSHAITTSGSSVSSATATEFGGLVYAASGHWVINDYALNLSGINLSAPNANKFGMLVCRAGSGVSSAGDSLVGLYLENRAPWATAYVVNRDKNAITTQAKVFDEWVADGRKPGQEVDDCAVNGVVSLHTREEKLHMTDDGTDAGGARNSYENRTAYGMEHQANGSVRYYYNLDRAVAYIKSSGLPNGDKNWIQKPEQLLVWSVSWYAPKAVRPYVWRESDGALLCWGKGRIGSMGGNASLNMTGYSYYPVDLTGINPYVYYSTIKFCFSDINKKESGNKQNSQPSQHMNMHAGLFGSYTGGKETMVLCVTLQGTIGSASGGTGALFSKFVKGQNGTANVTIDGLTLDGLSVDGAKDLEYAPLLINQMASKTNLTVRGHLKNKNIPEAGYVQGITVKPDSYKTGEKAATSLFGNLGDEKAEMVTANFQDITVPSSKTDGIFTHASLLESFAYDGTKSGSSASYIFYSKKHKEEDSSFTYFEPTYGAEIDTKGNDSEYEGQQRWYNDNKGYMTDDNLVTDGSITANEDTPQFANKYLPYVYKSKEGAGEHAHDTFHEIKVNQRVSNLLTGCGTYGDPYTLTNAAEVVTVANYINGKESAADGWQITVIGDQENLCTRRSDGSKGHELIYEYKRSQGSWVCTTDSSKTLSNDTMHSYIQGAYYSIEPADSKTETLNYIELDGNSFKGFGNKDNPFRGVIVGNLKQGLDKATLKIVKKTRTISGLIPYSYGCVVKGLNVEYSASSVATGSNDISHTKSSDGIPISFFGGIFGCILGGDNIIDGVAVNSSGFTVAGDGSGSHLVPIGGYVGAIAGGGVIFRNMSGTSWRAGTKTKFKSAGEGGANFQLYDNPYVGRVIDGYAFSEGKDCAVDNGDANYKINKLVDKGVSCVTATAASGNTAAQVTPTSSQGLLVLSAIINSGAASGGVSLAYEGGTYDTKTSYKFGNALYGKARNATYEHVGKPANVGSDFTRSIADDQTSPGTATDGSNLPYLVKNYADAATGSLCASSGVELQLASKEPYDMTSYGKGFTGLSGRYVSNACVSSKGIARDCIVPRIACINGNGVPIMVGTKDAAYGAAEYTDDDYKVSGVGGLFSTVMFTSTNVGPSVDANGGAQVKDLTFSNCNVALTYVDANGNIASGPASNDLIGTGLLAGATANYDGNTCGVYRNVQMKNCTVLGAKSVGGLLGSSGCAKQKTGGDVTYMVDFDSNFNNDFNKGYNNYTRAPVYLYDCSYTGLSVTGEKYVGGYVGAIASPCGVRTTEAEEVGEKAVGENSTITATGTIPYVGGVLGFANLSNISINTNTNKGTITAVQSSTTVISGVNVLATRPNKNQDMVSMGAGGVVGCARGGVISMSNVRIDAGGNTKSVTIGDNSGTNSIIRNVGGLIGRVTSSGSPNRYWFEDCSVKNVNVAGTNQCSGGLIGYYHSNVNIDCNNIAIEDSTIKGSWSGGLLGAINSGSDVINVTNTKVSNTTFGGTSNGGIAGDGRGQFHLVNVLMDSNTYKSGSKQGVLLGEVDTGDNKYSLSAAGVNVKPGNGKTTSDLPPMVYTTNTAAVNMKSYIAFGDYNDTLEEPDKGITLYGADNTATTAASPYVTTSPVSTLAVRASDNDTTNCYLFGDGVAIETAATIQSQAGDKVADRYTYTNIAGINDAGVYQNTSTYRADSSKSTFNANNVTSNKKAAADFPVLVIPGNDTTTVENYLNIVTNGGFSDARRLNGSVKHVTATAEVFSLADNGTFVKDATASQTPTLKVLNNGTSSMTFRASTDWDNEQGRFTLLTVTFSEAGQSYRVQVPIIVKRMLEIDFTATYSEGANFKASDYATKYDKHVLVSSGDTMTGYLTWTYGSARGDAVDYGWNTLLEAGGSMGPLNKSITFGATLPEGTQLTLVDTANNSREYHYTVGTGGATSVKLTEFVDAGNKAYYTEPWLSETVGVKAEEAEEAKDGAWVKLTDAEVKDKSQAVLTKMAGAKVKGAYYRARTSSDTTGKFYTLSVAKEEPKSENFYLVVRTPAGSAGVNGYTATTVDTSLNEHINYLLRGKTAVDGKAAEDGHQNTPSTYSVASNYAHNLIDNKDNISKMELKDATYPLSMDVSDTVTFDSNQQYTSSDALYYQIDSSLVTYHDGAIAGSVGYPTGTQGSYAFYVKVGENYYAWNGSGWTPAGATETPVVSGLTWKSKSGGDMSLVLADANGNSIDMSGLREIAKNHDNAFTITMKANLTMTEPACQSGIVASQKSGTDRYTKPNYRAYLSTHADTLSTSSNSDYSDGKAGYYRMDVGSSTIALEASKKSQLGINIDDLQSANGEIALVGTYDFSKVTGADAMISNADKVTYTLTLQHRQDDGFYKDVTGIAKYLSVLDSDCLGTGTLSADDNSYVFTDTKSNGTFATRDGNSLAFKHAFRVKVNTDVETAGQTYANYRLVLTAHMSGGGVNDTPVNVSNLDGYTNSDYVTYTLARINTQGIPHGTN